MATIRLLNPDSAIKLLSSGRSFPFSISTFFDDEEFFLVKNKRLKSSELNGNKIKIDDFEFDLYTFQKNIDIELVEYSWGIAILINKSDFGIYLNKEYELNEVFKNIDVNKIKILSLYGNNKLKNLNSVIKFKNIIALNIENTPNLVSIKNLNELKELEQLHISVFLYSKENQIQKINELKNLKYIKISNLTISSLELLFNLRSIEKLILWECKVITCKGIENFEKLNTLELLKCKIIKDVDLLGDLIKLKKIYIREPEFSNFDFLEKLINLESLEIISTPIENITPLRSLINLKYLNLSNNRRIKKIDVITVLKGLRTLLIEGSSIEDFIFLKELKNLKYLSLKKLDNYISIDLSPIGFLQQLTYLEFSCYHLNIDISQIKELSNIEDLKIFSKQILNIELIANFSKLRKLYLEQHDENDIKNLLFLCNLKNINTLKLYGFHSVVDISPIKNLQNIEQISIRGASIQNLSPLSNLLLLKEIKIFASIDRLEYFKKLQNLKSLDLYGCELITSIKPLLHCSKLEKINLEGCINILDFHLLSNLENLKEIEGRWIKPSSVHFVLMSNANRRGDIDKIVKNIDEWMIHLRFFENPVSYSVELISAINKISNIPKRRVYLEDLVAYIRYRCRAEDSLFNKESSHVWMYYSQTVFSSGEEAVLTCFKECLEKIHIQKELESVLYPILVALSEIPIVVPSLKSWIIELVNQTLADIQDLPDPARKIAPAAAVFYAGFGDPANVRYWIDKGTSAQDPVWLDHIYLALIAFHLKKSEFGEAKAYLGSIQHSDTRDKAIAQMAEQMAAATPAEATDLLQNIAQEALRFEAAQKIAQLPEVLNDTQSIFRLLLVLEQQPEALALLIDKALQGSQGDAMAQTLRALLLPAPPTAASASALLHLAQSPKIAQTLSVLNIGTAFFEELQAEALSEQKALTAQLIERLIQKGALKPEFSEIISNAVQR